MSQARIFFAMSRDGLLPTAVSKVHPRFGTPYVTTIITCVVVALFAGVTQIQVVGEITSIGTLFAFVMVCTSVLVLRLRRPDAHRPFRVPGGPIIPILGIVSCAYLMLSLPVITWVRFLGWLNIGFVIYWFYGRRHSPLMSAQEARRRTPLQAVANFVVAFGALGLFNGMCMLLLGLLTELGVTTEATAKWAELDALTTHFLGVHVTVGTADTFGLQALSVGAGVFVAGWLLSTLSVREIQADSLRRCLASRDNRWRLPRAAPRLLRWSMPRCDRCRLRRGGSRPLAGPDLRPPANH